MPLNPTVKLFQNNYYQQTQPILNNLQNQLQNYNSIPHNQQWYPALVLPSPIYSTNYNT
jgi:hypothetical protein